MKPINSRSYEESRSNQSDSAHMAAALPALKRLRVRVESTEGVRRVALYVPAGGSMERLGKGALLLLLPVALLQAALVRWRLAHANARYRRRSGVFRHSIGPAVLASASVERLLPESLRAASRCRQVGRDQPIRSLTTANGVSIFVFDDFYEDPQSVREVALQERLEVYEGSWSNTAWVGANERTWVKEAARKSLSAILGYPISETSFYSDCNGEVPGWNGSFNVKLREDWLSPAPSEIHNHLNLPPGSLAGVVFLDRNPHQLGGTSFWQCRSARSGRAMTGRRVYDGRTYRFRPTLRVQARFNRLVLFPSDVLHRGEPGYGSCLQDGRLFQVFFFTPPTDLWARLQD